MREKVKLLSTAGTGHFYVAMKNKRLHPEKLETKKYDPVVRKPAPAAGFSHPGSGILAPCPNCLKLKPHAAV